MNSQMELDVRVTLRLISFISKEVLMLEESFTWCEPKQLSSLI